MLILWFLEISIKGAGVIVHNAVRSLCGKDQSNIRTSTDPNREKSYCLNVLAEFVSLLMKANIFVILDYCVLALFINSEDLWRHAWNTDRQNRILLYSTQCNETAIFMWAKTMTSSHPFQWNNWCAFCVWNADNEFYFVICHPVSQIF
jgi:hypothetical protein